MTKEIPSYLVGSGMAARAMRSALALVQTSDSDLHLSPTVHLKRGEPIPRVHGPHLFLIANPHALHADLILEAEAKGFTHIITEKPVAVSIEQVEKLRSVEAKVAVCHGYRQMWGPQRLRHAILSEELGELISIEGRYWQSSAAAHALEKKDRESWKNDIRLSGPFDTFFDLGSHWADLVTYLVGTHPSSARAKLHYANAEAPHRDTHVQLELDFRGGLRTWGSISKTVHGKGNHLEIMVVGSRAAMEWNFERSDELSVGKGAELKTLSRPKEQTAASGFPPQHALGWLEGYVSIVHQVLREMTGHPAGTYPTLPESLAIARMLLEIDL